MLREIGAAATLAMFAVAAAAETTVRERSGYAYELGKDRLLYIEEHEETVAGGRVALSEITYRRTGGEVIATKRLNFAGDATSPDFRLENPGNGHLEGAKRENGRLVVFFRKSDSHELSERALRPPEDAIIDGGFDRFIEANWSRLIQGEVFERPFLVPAFQKFLDFRIYLERAANADVVFVMEPASLLVRLVGGRIVVTYDRDSAALKRYEGISNIRDPDGNNYEVRVEFPAAGRSRDIAGEARGDAPGKP